MWITIPNKEENYAFDKVERGELFIDHTDKNGSGEEQVYLRIEDVELNCDVGFEINAVNLHTGDLFFFYDEDAAEPIKATMNIKRG